MWEALSRAERPKEMRQRYQQGEEVRRTLAVVQRPGSQVLVEDEVALVNVDWVGKVQKRGSPCSCRHAEPHYFEKSRGASGT